ncbi:uncharacterized protein LOC142412328 isoform X2 [Mycteria americana]|uniref:uncharacterized protein LOC142412328 isoform X2 n=1 Tax=Mycteria americana TaxID=33587 RepID=UPI003F58C458
MSRLPDSSLSRRREATSRCKHFPGLSPPDSANGLFQETSGRAAFCQAPQCWTDPAAPWSSTAAGGGLPGRAGGRGGSSLLMGREEEPRGKRSHPAGDVADLLVSVSDVLTQADFLTIMSPGSTITTAALLQSSCTAPLSLSGRRVSTQGYYLQGMLTQRDSESLHPKDEFRISPQWSHAAGTDLRKAHPKAPWGKLSLKEREEWRQ